jgi:hypothetical protein
MIRSALGDDPPDLVASLEFEPYGNRLVVGKHQQGIDFGPIARQLP